MNDKYRAVLKCDNCFHMWKVAVEKGCKVYDSYKTYKVLGEHKNRSVIREESSHDLHFYLICPNCWCQEEVRKADELELIRSGNYIKEEECRKPLR